MSLGTENREISNKFDSPSFQIILYRKRKKKAQKRGNHVTLLYFNLLCHILGEI